MNQIQALKRLGLSNEQLAKVVAMMASGFAASAGIAIARIEKGDDINTIQSEIGIMFLDYVNRHISSEQYAIEATLLKDML